MKSSVVESHKRSLTPLGPTTKKTHLPMERPPFERIALIYKAEAPSAPIRPASTRLSPRRTCIRIGSPASRSAP